MRDWVTNVETTHYVLGSAMGPHPYPTIVRDLQRRIGDEAAAQIEAGRGPAAGPRAGLRRRRLERDRAAGRFIGEPSVRLAVAEAAGDGIATGRHAAALAGGSPGHPPRRPLDDAPGRDGQVVEAHSASAGLDYPGIGPQLAALDEAGRIEVAAATDDEAVRGDALTRADRGHPAGARDGPRDRGPAAAPCRHRAVRARPWPDETPRPARVLGPWRQGPRGVRTLADVEPRAERDRRRRSRRRRPARTTPPARDRIARGLRAAPAAERPRGAHPVRRRRLPGRRHELRDRARRGRCRRRPARGRPAVLRPAGRRRDAPAGIQVALAAGATLERSIALVERIARGPPGPAARRRWATPTRSSAAATARRRPRRACRAPARPGSSSPT